MTEHLRDADLQLYLDRRLDERAKLDHLRGCPVCQERLDAYEPLFAALAAEPEWTPSPALKEKVMRKIRRDTLGPIYENLLNTILIIGGIIAALTLAMPYFHTQRYVEGARKYRIPQFEISWEWLKQLNFLPQLDEIASKLTLPVSSLVLFAAALLLVALADQLIVHARRHSLPHNQG
jgi:hypothetical protein